MTAKVPDHLRTTVELVRRAFPNGVPEVHFLPVIAILSDELSYRNLADVLTIVVGTPGGGVAYHEVLRGVSMAAELDLAPTRAILRAAGLDAWAAEEDLP